MVTYRSRILPLRASRLARIGTVVVVSMYVVTVVAIAVFCEVLSRL